MKPFVLLILLAALVVALHTTCYATGTLSCQGGIVSIGDNAGEVIGKCGQPAYTTQRERKNVENNAKGTRDKVITSTVIDDWTFNFGPNQFQYRILLENGIVTQIESLNYGY